MRRLLPLVVLCATAAPAVADGVYFSESVGGTKVKDELSDTMDSAMRIRVAIGYRRKAWAIEGWFAGDMGMDPTIGPASQPGAPCRPPGCDDRPYFDNNRSLLAYGLDVKFLHPVSKHLELYLRGSMSYGILDTHDYGGRGLGMGAGIQLKGRVPAAGLLFWPLFFTDWGPKMTAAVFVDDGFDFYRLHPGGKLDATPAIDAQLTHMTIGFAVGSDF